MTSRIAITITIGSRITSAFDDHASSRQPRAHAVAKIPLKLDGAIRDGAAGSAGTFQILTEFLQKRRVVRQVVDNRHRLAAAAVLFHSQLRDDAGGNRLGGELAAALTVGLGPAAAGAYPAESRGVDEPRLATVGHATS